jgi:hypothetical protein
MLKPAVLSHVDLLLALLFESLFYSLEQVGIQRKEYGEDTCCGETARELGTKPKLSAPALTWKSLCAGGVKFL